MEYEEHPLAPIDGVVRKLGLPRPGKLLDAIAPETVLSEKLGLTSPGEVIEEVLEDVKEMRPGKFELPGMGR